MKRPNWTKADSHANRFGQNTRNSTTLPNGLDRQDPKTRIWFPFQRCRTPAYVSFKTYFRKGGHQQHSAFGINSKTYHKRGSNPL